MSGPATLDDFRKAVVASVAQVGRSFQRPEDDWVHVLFIQSPAGVEIIGLSPDLFASAQAKDRLGELLKRYVAQRSVYRYALLASSWSAHVEDGEMPKGPVKDMAGASEQLMLVVGDAESEQMWFARIVRHDKLPPTLDPWKRHDGPGATFDGRFVGLNEYL